jgi:hypothetical protein
MAVVPIAVMPVVMPPIAMMMPVSAVAITVTPPAAIACFLNGASLLGFQSKYAG